MRELNWHPTPEPGSEFLEISEYAKKHRIYPDRYGVGKFLNEFEEEMADRFGKPAAIFLSSGTMAQGIALRIWSDQTQSKRIGFHPLSHIQLKEHLAYQHLHQLEPVFIEPLFPEQLSKCLADGQESNERLSSVLIELPIRATGGTLPTWEQLEQIKQIAESRNQILHLDGARIWETQVFYQKSLAQICAGFHSVYVSFYKGLGSTSGSMLFGDKEFIKEAKIWLRRCGGNLHELHNLVIPAKINYEKRINEIPAFIERTQSLAAALSEIEGLRIQPDPPQINMFHLYFEFPTTLEKLKTARDQLVSETGVKICRFFMQKKSEPKTEPKTEIVIGDSAKSVTNEEAVELFQKLVKLARL